ncbi:hypothetical protein OAG71_01460 [bacterium]|nr:hypothetical protein [bacterium]
MFNQNSIRFSRLCLSITIGTLLLIVMSNDWCFAQETDSDNQLRWRLKTGERFKVTLTKSGNVETQVDTRIRKVEIESELEFDWNVIKTGDGETTIEQTLKKVVLESGAPGDVSAERLSFDSSNIVYKKGVSNKVANQLKPLIGLTYQFVMTDLGEIKSVMVAEDQKRMLETIPATLPIKDLLTSQGQQSNLAAATWVCPETLSDDREWSTEQVLDSELGTYNRISRYTASELDGGTVQIDVVTDVKHDPKMALKLFEGKGQIEFDAANGFVRSSESSTRMTTESPYRDLIVKTTIEMESELKMEKQN